MQQSFLVTRALRRAFILPVSLALLLSGGCGGARYAPGPEYSPQEHDYLRADPTAAFNACVAVCSENTSLALVTRTGCLEGCEEVQRNFPLTGKAFSTRQDCLDAILRQESNKEANIREMHAMCDAKWTHVHNRKGCYIAAEAFYASLAPASMCGSDGTPFAAYDTPPVTGTTPPPAALPGDTARDGAQPATANDTAPASPEPAASPVVPEAAPAPQPVTTEPAPAPVTPVQNPEPVTEPIRTTQPAGPLEPPAYVAKDPAGDTAATPVSVPTPAPAAPAPSPATGTLPEIHDTPKYQTATPSVKKTAQEAPAKTGQPPEPQPVATPPSTPVSSTPAAAGPAAVPATPPVTDPDRPDQPAPAPANTPVAPVTPVAVPSPAPETPPPPVAEPVTAAPVPVTPPAPAAPPVSALPPADAAPSPPAMVPPAAPEPPQTPVDAPKAEPPAPAAVPAPVPPASPAPQATPTAPAAETPASGGQTQPTTAMPEPAPAGAVPQPAPQSTAPAATMPATPPPRGVPEPQMPPASQTGANQTGMSQTGTSLAPENQTPGDLRQGPPQPGLNANRPLPPSPETGSASGPVLMPPVPSMLNRPYNAPTLISPQIEVPPEDPGSP